MGRHGILEVRPQRGDRQSVRPGHDIRSQLILSVAILPGHDHGLADAGDSQERGLNFGRLDAVAANLDLFVESTHELQRAVGSPAHPIASPKQPGVRVRAERMRDEAILRSVRGRSCNPLPNQARPRPTRLEPQSALAACARIQDVDLAVA